MTPTCPRCGSACVDQRDIRETFAVTLTEFACGTKSWAWQDGLTRTDFGSQCKPKENENP